MTAPGLAELADRTLLVDGGWSVVVVEASLLASTANSLEEEFNLVLDSAASAVQVPARVPSGPSLIERLASLRSTNVAIVLLRDDEAEAASRSLDYGRGRLVDRCRGVIVTSDAGLRTLAALAPSFWSWTGAQVWRPDLTSGMLHVDTRLASIRKEMSKSDAEVVQQAEEGTLPADPVYAEWLTLLGRGDLIGR